MFEFGVAALLLSVITTTFNLGFFTFAGFGIALILLVLVFIIFKKFKEINFQQQSGKTEQSMYAESILTFILISLSVIFLFYSSGIYQKFIPASVFITIFPILIFPIILTYLKRDKLSKYENNRKRYLFLLFSALLLRIAIVIASPDPAIDVFVQLKEGPLKLLSLENPYSAVFTQVYQGIKSDYYNYWPTPLLLELPFVAVFRDPRILLVLLDLINALLIYLIGERKKAAELLSLIYLFRPNSLFMIEQSFLTPMEFFFLVLIVFILKYRGRLLKYQDVLLGILLGMVSAAKFHYLVLLPVFLINRKQKSTVFLSFLITLCILVLPFLIWNPLNFYQDTIGFFLNIFENRPNIPIYNSLNFNTVYFLFFRKNMNFALNILALLILYLYILKKIINRKLSYMILGLSLYTLSFYLLSTHAFISYHYIVGGLLILWLDLELTEKFKSQKI